MRSSNHELIIHRGETFTLDFQLTNKDGSPYIVGKDLINPHYLITIASALYRETNRRIIHYWIPVTEVFEYTQIVNLSDIKNASDSDTPKYDSLPAELPSGYFNGLEVQFEEGDCVFKHDGEYYYYDDGWKKYESHLVVNFPGTDTSKLIEQNYFYSIRLVGGNKLDSNNKNTNDIDNSIPILPSTKLSVLSNLTGGM